ncbi:hypothetical protein JH314_21395 [Xanthomonas campestris]|uniref:hypothetical protein n=1 Tax=Xanthomonas campestris TaxID=339 RepID=UPI002367ED5A|nr:hypothetical protein [Xanthomonas campestris]WDJ01804.1 hypothetical protein JH314_21395 [Xanthomonas campestris]
MKLSDYRSAYYAFTTKASEIARQLSFAGIALIWVFKPKDAVPTAIPKELLLPAIFFATALAFNLLHAAYGSFAWGMFTRHHEKKLVRDDDPVSASRYLNWPSIVLFWAVVALVVAAYALTLLYIRSLLVGGP